MDLETVIQGEVSQKEKNKYRILTHICGIHKSSTDEPVCKAEIENRLVVAKGEEQKERDELGVWGL